MLTAKQESACQAFVLSPDKNVKGNKTASYKAAFKTDNMKPATINRAAKELFDLPKITARVEELQNEIKSALIADEVELQEFWSSVMRGEESSGVDSDGKEYTDMNYRLKSSELLGKNKALFVDRKDHKVKVDGNWTVEFVNATPETK